MIYARWMALAAVAIAGLIAGLLIGRGIWMPRGVDNSEIIRLTETASESKAEARKFAKVAHDAESRELDARRTAEELKARIAALRGASVPSGQPLLSGSGMAVGSEPVALPGPPDLLVLYPELIAAQDTQIAALKDQVNAQKGQIASLEKALRDTELRADIQAQATRAALAGIREARWISRAEGFAAGAITGYFGGRR